MPRSTALSGRVLVGEVYPTLQPKVISQIATMKGEAWGFPSNGAVCGKSSIPSENSRWSLKH